MAYRAEITDTVTGETRVSVWSQDWLNESDDPENPGSLSQFMWGDGNYACDCNRGQFFAEVKGEPDPDAECSGSRYRVRITDAAGEKVLYQDSQN